MSPFGMAIHDPRRPDSEFATELGCKAFAGGRHGNENGNVAVCGSRVGLWSIVGVPWSQLDLGGPTEGSPLRASASRGR